MQDPNFPFLYFIYFFLFSRYSMVDIKKNGQ